jgi:hypothetical protein
LKSKFISRPELVGRSATAIVTLGLVYVLILAFPKPLFAHTLTYGSFHVWSDQPIDSAMTTVLDEAKHRIARSDLYDPKQQYRIFICNSSWRLFVYSQVFNDKLGGITDDWLTRNIYIRASDIALNEIISPRPGPIQDAMDRPLSYFIAHEATHVMETRAFGRLMAFRYPTWLLEGYADYIGKAERFDFDENRKLLVENNPKLDYNRSGLYRLYHLEVALLLDKHRLSIRQVFARPPSEASMLELLKSPRPI